jgi:hypothetical protein
MGERLKPETGKLTQKFNPVWAGRPQKAANDDVANA